MFKIHIGTSPTLYSYTNFNYFFRFRNWNTRLTLKGPASPGTNRVDLSCRRRSPSPADRNGQIKEENGELSDCEGAVNGISQIELSHNSRDAKSPCKAITKRGLSPSPRRN